MQGKLLGVVTEPEKRAIQALYQRKLGLMELIAMFEERPRDGEEARYHGRASAELADIDARYAKWWLDMVEKYRWQVEPGSHWHLDFDTNAVRLS